MFRTDYDKISFIIFLIIIPLFCSFFIQKNLSTLDNKSQKTLKLAQVLNKTASEQLTNDLIKKEDYSGAENQNAITEAEKLLINNTKARQDENDKKMTAAILDSKKEEDLDKKNLYFFMSALVTNLYIYVYLIFNRKDIKNKNIEKLNEKNIEQEFEERELLIHLNKIAEGYLNIHINESSEYYQKISKRINLITCQFEKNIMTVKKCHSEIEKQFKSIESSIKPIIEEKNFPPKKTHAYAITDKDALRILAKELAQLQAQMSFFKLKEKHPEP